MSLPFDPEPVPIRLDEGGAVRVGRTRVLFELVVHAFVSGETPETIVDSYDTLQLADVYAVIAYYLRHKEDVEEYLKEHEKRVAEIRAKIQARQGDGSDLKARLLARREAMRKNGTWPGDG
jgi:uncharacterized protein (DUF433 family)